jgi:hypothetical protein
VLVALLAALALAASACVADEDDDSASDDAPAEDEAPAGDPDAPAPGVDEDSIAIGYSYLDFDFLVDQGLSPAGWGDQELAFQTLVDDVNANGGIDGRMLEVTFEPYSPVGTEAAEAACLRLTEDTEQFAVLGGFLGPSEPANTCIAGRGETILVGGVQSQERLDEATATWITDRPDRVRQADALLSLLDGEGELEGRSVAVVTNTDAEESRAGVVDLLGDYGVEAVEDVLLDAPIGDIVAEDAAWAPVAESIRGAGADTVLIVGNPSSSIRNIASQSLDVDMWVVDQEALRNLGSSVDLEDAAGALTAAPLSGQAAWDDETVEPCRTVFTEANPDVEVIDPDDLEENDEDWTQNIMLGCRMLQLFQAVAEEAGENLNVSTFDAAVGTVGEFSLPVQPFASLAADKLSTNDSFQLAEFDPSAGGSGGLTPITEISNVQG